MGSSDSVRASDSDSRNASMMISRRIRNENRNYAKCRCIVRVSLCDRVFGRICTLGGDEYDERLETH